MAASPISVTMAPFLYQTRTLAGFTRAGLVHLRPRLFVKRYQKGRRSFSSARRDGDKATEDHSNEGDNKVAVRRTAFMHSPSPHNLDATWDASNGEVPEAEGLVRRTWETPSDEPSQDPRDVVTRDRKSHYDAKPKAGTSIDFDNDEDNVYEEIDAIDQLARSSGPQEERTSTITTQEKQAFQKIFSDIFTRSQAPVQRAPSMDIFDEDIAEAPPGKSATTTPASIERKLHDIMRQAVMQTPAQKLASVNRFPAPLRAAAARAIGLKLDAAKKLEDASSVDEDASFHARLEELRKPERDRVEALMQEAKTDFDLWAILEKEVFTLIPRLGLKDGAMRQKKVAKRGSKKDVKRSEAPTPLATEALDLLPPSEDGISALSLYGPLYPSYLLLALRLLDRVFLKPSPLALALLPKIKSFGTISHVLGASTKFYNELIVISWYRHDNFLGAETLLQEMEQFGLDWDSETLEIVRKLSDLQTVTLRGDRGILLKTLWSLPEFAPRKFRPWKEKIQRAIDEREAGAFA